ncbi:MAG: hypothetical protein COB88_04770 [Flavobacteriales bacterium]|nr:MAG: hypothetical protein COB88_04770 [Flavobacteriales bacterium]
MKAGNDLIPLSQSRKGHKFMDHLIDPGPNQWQSIKDRFAKRLVVQFISCCVEILLQFFLYVRQNLKA